MSFVPRTFPPPALANVPVEYIVNQLHSLAPHYWSKPETADCTIVIPLDALYRSKPEQASRSSPDAFSGSFVDPSCEGQKATNSTSRPIPRMVMKLHIDYLSAQSSLLRGIFSGVPPQELVEQVTSSSQTPDSDSPFIADINARLTPRPNPVPRILPSNPNHPTLLLPIPDPSSFRHLVHYVYFGSTTFISEALDNGTINWEGLARNVEYLGMNIDIKLFLGRWYGQWKRRRDDFDQDDEDEDDNEEYDSDDSYDGSEDDEEYDYFESESVGTSTTLNFEDEQLLEDDFKSVEIEPPRGRNRHTRRLGHATSDPGLNATRPRTGNMGLNVMSRGRSR
ncbi:hypothetical protein C8Q75DRAFT_727813 [Abortiporus biennis]|nr:hypothetical protein C8Q75DRAFT_727813 [Abortiporus biennis]